MKYQREAHNSFLHHLQKNWQLLKNSFHNHFCKFSIGQDALLV